MISVSSQALLLYGLILLKQVLISSRRRSSIGQLKPSFSEDGFMIYWGCWGIEIKLIEIS